MDGIEGVVVGLPACGKESVAASKVARDDPIILYAFVLYYGDSVILRVSGLHRDHCTVLVRRCGLPVMYKGIVCSLQGPCYHTPASV